jgi:hypothetical protein
MNIKKILVSTIAVGTMMFAIVLPAFADTTTVYDSIPNSLPGNVPSVGFEATATSEFGGQIGLDGSEREDPTITVLMSSWACQAGTWFGHDCTSDSDATYTHPVTINVYAVGSDNSVGSLITSKTETFTMPYRPSDDDIHCTGADAGKWYDGSSCNNGKAFSISFDLSGVTLPDTVIVGVAYNTSNYGEAPIGVQACNSTPQGCPYDSLNVGTSPTVNTGTALPTENDAYANSSSAASYCDAGSDGTGVFRLDAGCWTGFLPAFRIEASTPVVANGEITSPTDGEHVSGTLNLTATYADGDVPNNDDAVQWAVRSGTCNAGTGTVLGNVDGKTDVASWDGNSFSFSSDVSAYIPGAYCFVFNPTDDAGQPDIRLTRNFIIDAPLVSPPTTLAQCKKNGWKTFNDPSFKNQGQCVKYVNQHAHTILGNVKYTANGLARTAQFTASTAEDGAFQYTDASHNWYKVLITSTKVQGHEGWFAGKVLLASNHSWVGQWLFAKVSDASPHQLWGSFTTMTGALTGVSNMSNPADGPFNTTGALVVH